MSPPIYGQVVVGPPGSGKTTYCDGMQQYLRLLGRKEAWVINLDPANERTSWTAGPNETKNGSDDDMKKREEAKEQGRSDSQKLPYETLLNVCDEVVNLSSVMEKTGLGPNGGLVYCMEYLEAHADELVQKIRERISDRTYLLLDLPGQVELYTHSTCVQNLLIKLVQELDLRLAAVQLIDAHYCTDASKFLSSALLATTTMLRLELPTVSVLSKVDLLAGYGELDFQFDYYTDCHDLNRLVPFVNQPGRGQSNLDIVDEDDVDIAQDPDYQRARRKLVSTPFHRKHAKLHSALAEVVEDFGLLQYLPLDISDAASVGRVLAKVDKCNGYVFTESPSIQTDLFQCAVQQDTTYEDIADIQERISGTKIVNRTKGQA